MSALLKSQNVRLGYEAFSAGNVTLDSNEASAGTETVELCHRLPPQPAGAILKETGQFISLITMD